ncbi:MAG: flagellar hook-associated protein FlgK [Roseiarcus sp.]
MSLSSTYAILTSAFASSAAQSSVIASNISNADTPGYAREVANQITTGDGGSEVVSITRQTNAALFDQLSASTSESAAQSAIANGLATLAQTVDDSSTNTSTSGADQNGNSPAAMLGNLQSALATYETSPSSAASANAVLTAAENLASSLNQGAQAVSSVQEQADQNIATSVGTINSLLSQFQLANNAVVSGLANGSDISQAEDTRDSLLTQLSQQIGISTTTDAHGSMSIYTDSGVTLFQTAPQTVSFTPTAAFSAGSVGNPVTVDGIPITGSSAPMAIQSGALAGYVQLRDVVAPQYVAQLDQIAGGLVSAFAESDQSATPTLPDLPGLFTAPSLTSVPSDTQVTGLASEIEVNPNVIPADGGNLELLQNGGISDPGNPAYTYNTTGAAGYTGRIQEMDDAITGTQSFDSTAGLGGSSGLLDYADNSVSWLQGQNQSASDAASYQSSVVSQAQSALSNATGVNLDTEMTNMLNIENSYTSTAKLLTTVNNMFSALLAAA